MKKHFNIVRKTSILTIILLVFSCVAAYAQKDVVKFLGIPVDGTKQAMIQKIKAKGFTYDAKYDRLEGEFNGVDSYVYIVTNRNKVYRIMVTDTKSYSEAQIKIRFNNLCQQFSNNNKYAPTNLTGDYYLDDDEDISYGIKVKNKQYSASYYQLASKDLDSAYMQQQLLEAGFVEDLQDYLASKYSQEQLENPTEEINNDVINYSQTYALEFWFSRIQHRAVWFTISDDRFGYSLCIYYDNKLNKANGEDL